MSIQERVPEGWRLYSVDNSIISSCSITLKRDKNGERLWHSLDEDEQEIKELFLCSSSNSFEDAFEKVCKLAEENPTKDISKSE